MISAAVVAGLAGARLTRAWLHETIGEAPRNAVLDWTDDVEVEIDAAGGVTVVAPGWLLRTRSWTAELVDCPHCIGFWFTLASAVGLRWRPTRTVVLGLAGAMIASTVADHYPRFDPAGSADE